MMQDARVAVEETLKAVKDVRGNRDAAVQRLADSAERTARLLEELAKETIR